MADATATDEVLKGVLEQYEMTGNKACATKIQALLNAVKSLKLSVAVIGEESSGKSTLVNALRGHQECYDESHIPLFFKNTEKTRVPISYPFPTYPNVMLWELPGYDAEASLAQCLKSIDLNYDIFVLVVVGCLTDTHVKLLKTIKQKKKLFQVVCTKVDLEVHTSKRILGSLFTLKTNLQTLKKGCTEKLSKEGLDADRFFLVSGLEPAKYDFTQLEDNLEKDILSLKRKFEASAEGLKCRSQEKMQQICEVCETSPLACFPVIISSVFSAPINILLDIAVIGETGSGKSSFVNALRNVTAFGGEEAETGVTATTKIAAAFPYLGAPNIHVWDLPGFGAPDLPMEQYLENMQLDRYDFFIVIASERYKHAHSVLVKAIVALGKRFFYIRNKIDADMGTGHKQEAPLPLIEAEKRQSRIKQDCIDALRKEGVAQPNVFLVSSLAPEEFDMQEVRKTLAQQVPGLKKEALLRAIPALITTVVRKRRKELMKNVYGKALQTCLHSIEINCKEAVCSLTSILSAYCIELGLDQESIQQIAETTGTPVEELKNEIQCPLAKEIKEDDVLKQVCKSVPLTALVWTYVPYWGQSNSPEMSFEATYSLLKGAVWDLAEDTERVLLKAYAENLHKETTE
uniref:Interferon-inducible GTPase 5-like n=1 Tax=Geotrypetes seraphini TaxID=260995 RepID=A0A6P8STM5_GEOSA|nr:interferon-inducible GTPase 5-like [Geotrypetes seraphini]XP_033819423.1 interferon-inducible GTPase 5-like [Geotrypetes seraphini]